MTYYFCKQDIATYSKKDDKYILNGYVKYDTNSIISNCSFLIDAKFVKYIMDIKIIYDDTIYTVQFNTISNTYWKIGEYL